jgi:hypothetical protein
MVRRTGHGLLRRPSALQSALYRCRRQPGKSDPLGQRASYAVGRDQSVGASIPGLHFARHPSHVSRRIRAVVVDSINRVLGRRPVANRISERDERRLPSFIHLDAAPAVVRERRIARVGAALRDLAPDPVQRSVRQPVLGEQALARVFDQAAAASGFRDKRRRPNNGLTAAVAATEPANPVPPGMDRFDDKFAEAFAGQVFECSHAQALYSSTGVKQNG